MVRAVIADDEQGSRQLLRMALGQTKLVEVIAEACDGAECLRYLFQETPDVLFLDVEMPRLSGIEVAEEALRAADAPLVIFVTNHDDHAVRAFALAAVDYVVKDPDVAIFESRVALAVVRVAARLAQRSTWVEHQRGAVRDLAERTGMGRSVLPGRLPVRDHAEGTVRLLDPAEILSVERRGRRAEVRTREARFPTYYTIDGLLERLAPLGFVRASRSSLLNINHIAHLIPNGDGSYDAVLDDTAATVVPVSRANARALLGSPLCEGGDAVPDEPGRG